MINYQTGEPTARYWVLKLLKDNFGPGDRLVGGKMSKDFDTVIGQGFETNIGKKLLLVNKYIAPQTLRIPAEFGRGKVTFVAPSSGDRGFGHSVLKDGMITLESGEVAIITQ
jgi:hypothetical protein